MEPSNWIFFSRVIDKNVHLTRREKTKMHPLKNHFSFVRTRGENEISISSLSLQINYLSGPIENKEDKKQLYGFPNPRKDFSFCTWFPIDSA